MAADSVLKLPEIRLLPVNKEINAGFPALLDGRACPRWPVLASGLPNSEKNGDGQTSKGGGRERWREIQRSSFLRRHRSGHCGNLVK